MCAHISKTDIPIFSTSKRKNGFSRFREKSEKLEHKFNVEKEGCGR
jgi:hypothetical protein